MNFDYVTVNGVNSNVELRELRNSGAIRRYQRKQSKQIYNGGRSTCLQNRDLTLF